MFRPFISTHLASPTLRNLTAPPLSLQPKLPFSHAADVIFPKVSVVLLFEPPRNEEEIVARVDRLLSRPGVVMVICIDSTGKDGYEKGGREELWTADESEYCGVMVL